MPNEHCCCGCVHVKTGAFIIGLMYLISGCIFVIALLVTGNFQRILTIIFLIIFIGGGILYADQMHKPQGYLPYLSSSAALISFYTIFIYIFIMMIIFVPETLGGKIYPILYPQEKVHSGGDSGWWISDEKMGLFNLMMMTTTTRTPYGNKSLLTLRLELFLIAAVMALTDGIAMWFLSVVYRAYRYMKIEIGEPYRGEPYLEFDYIRR